MSLAPASVDTATCWDIRRQNFPSTMTFHTPGLKQYKTSEYDQHNATEFVSVSLTGTACALNCDHCQTSLLKGMVSLPRFDGSLFKLGAALAQRGARGLLISGGSDARGRVPMRPYLPDMRRLQNELGLKLRLHVGLPDEETCAALAELQPDGVMLDIIGHTDTIRQVYHLNATPDDYETVLARLAHYNLPTIPHIILGLHYGQMLGEWRALEMIQRYPPQVLVLVVLMPLSHTPMAQVEPPTLPEMADFFTLARTTLPATPIMLGCARPAGPVKVQIDRLAIDAGFNGIAFPADGMVNYARERGLSTNFINACCGVMW